MNQKALGFLLGVVGVVGLAVTPMVRGVPTPKDYSGYLVYVADGSVPADEFLILGEDAIEVFHKGVMGRSDDEVLAHMEAAAEFFWDRFGLDVNDTANLLFAPLFMNPGANYRAYTIGGERVRRDGWVVRDGGWMVTAVNPDGVELGGEFAGTRLNAGDLVLYGEYNIQVDGQHSTGKDEIVIRYKSGCPLVPNPNGFAFFCDLESEDYGTGAAHGTSQGPVDELGMMNARVRNVLLFE